MSITQIHPALAGKIRERLDTYDNEDSYDDRLRMDMMAIRTLTSALRAEVDAADEVLHSEPDKSIARWGAEVDYANATLRRIAANLGIEVDSVANNQKENSNA